MTYIDGFVFVVPKNKMKAYKQMAELGKKVWMEHGALDYKECMLDDAKTMGTMTFTKLTKAKANEKVFFSFIVFKSKAHRNKVNSQVMKDKRMDPASMGMTEKDMPFDMAKMAYGGFETIVGK